MEQWREISGYEGIYEVSNEGRIRSCLGKTTRTVRHGERHWKQRVLKQKNTRNGKGRTDARVCLWKDGAEKTYLVSRLVAFAWCGGYSKGFTVNHKDGNPLNNYANNLEWVTGADNTRKGFENNQFSTQKKTILVDSSGNEHVFRSMSDASRFLGYNPGYISTLLNRGSEPTALNYTIRIA